MQTGRKQPILLLLRLHKTVSCVKSGEEPLQLQLISNFPALCTMLPVVGGHEEAIIELELRGIAPELLAMI